MTDPLAAAREAQAPRMHITTTQRAIIRIPEGCHLMLDAKDLAALSSARFVRIEPSGDIKPTPLGNMQVSILPVAVDALHAIDQASFQAAKDQAA